MEPVQTQQQAGIRVHLYSKLESSSIYKVANNKYLHAGLQLWIAVLALYKQNILVYPKYYNSKTNDILMWSN